MSAELIATRRRERDEAVAARVEALAAVSAVQERIDRRRAAQADITQRRLADAAVAGDAQEYAALAGDLVVLEQVLAAKHEALRQIDVDGPAARLAEAEATHCREQDETAFRALQQRCADIDAALVGAIRAAGELGDRIGRTRVREIFRPSKALDFAIRLGVRP